MKPITYTNIDEINDWLVKNFDDYLDTKELLEKKLVKIDSQEKFEEQLKANLKANEEFRKEREFSFKYETLRNLVILRNKDEKIKEIINGFNNLENDEIGLLCYKSNAYNLMLEIDSKYTSIRIVYNNNNEPTGIKSFESPFINVNTHIVPLDGFENFVELHRIFKLEKWKTLYEKYEHLFNE